MTTRRDFLKHSALGAAGLTIGGLGFSTESFANIMGANEKNCMTQKCVMP